VEQKATNGLFTTLSKQGQAAGNGTGGIFPAGKIRTVKKGFCSP
jgi:hypothetical protein